MQQHVDVRWAQVEEQRLMQQNVVAQTLGERASRPLSDRDSISTLSRFNQFDERRSFTMRSQYTHANQANRNLHQFGFFKLTGEALKRILGISSHASSRPPKENLQRNLNLTAARLGKATFGAGQHCPDAGLPASKITVIDPGDNHYFKRQVLKQQLLILRFISLLSSAFVILSPVAMLLLPRMDSLLRSHDYTDSVLASQPSTGELSASTPSVMHAVGLTGTNKQSANQPHQAYFVPQPQWRIGECNSDCDGLLIGFIARLIMLVVAYWAIFFRPQTATLPRIEFHRCLLVSIAVLLTLAYWLFFIFRLFDKRFNDFELQYVTIVHFASSMLESLILLHYLAVILLHLRQQKKTYCIKVIRSPDGASQYYSCGALSIQRCAQFVLDKYHRDFKHFGPYADHLIQLEDSIVVRFSAGARGQQQGQTRSPRSRASSPADSHRNEPSSGRRSVSRASRHRSRAEQADHRSPSRSPVRSSRSRSQRKRSEVSPENSRSNHSKLYHADMDAQEQHSGATSADNAPNSARELRVDQGDAKDHENDSNSADQSSDATNRMKESSLETIKAANSSADFSGQQKAQDILLVSSSGHKSDHRHHAARDETESVRSARSRRSTGRSHNRRRDHHGHHHRERSSNRAAEHVGAQETNRHLQSAPLPCGQDSGDPLEEHERKLRKRKLRLIAAVQDTFEQVKRVDEGEFLYQLSFYIDTKLPLLAVLILHESVLNIRLIPQPRSVSHQAHPSRPLFESRSAAVLNLNGPSYCHFALNLGCLAQILRTD